MRRLVFIALCGVLAAAIAGCGDPKHRQRTVTLTGHAVKIAADQYFFDPNHIIVGSGKIKINFINEGNLIHNLVLEREGRPVAKAASLEPKTQDSITADLAKGKYVLLCTVGDHEELGMRGEIEVTR